MRRRRAFAISIAALSALGVSADPGATPSPKLEVAPAPSVRWATLDLEGQFREQASNFATRLALPIVHQRTSATLLQVNAAKGAQSLGAIGGGLVQRFRPYGGEWVFGFYGFYEARQTSRAFDFQQVAFGLEASRGRHTVRANGWLPTTGGRSEKHGRNRIFESPTAGFDVEYELALPSPGLQLQPHLAVGYYYLEGTHGVSGKDSGFKARADVQYRWLTAGVEWREDDRAFGGNWLGTMRVSIPFGADPAKQDRTASKLLEPVRRDLWPTTFERTKRGPAPEPRRAASANSAPTPVANPTVDDCCGGAPAVIIYD